MAPLRKGRPAIGTTALAVLIVIVIVVGGAIGISIPKSAKASSTSTTTVASTTSMSSSAMTSSSTASNSAASESSAGSNSTGTPIAPAAPLFNFTVESGPTSIFISPGETLDYASVYFIPAPSTLDGAALFNQGIGDELVVMNATLPSGLSMQFYDSNLTNTIYTEIDAGAPGNVPFTLTAAQGIAAGSYPIELVASSGTLTVNYSFMVEVTPYLVTINFNAFHPGTLTVPVGTTVVWLSVDQNMNNEADVVFTTIDVSSPVINPNPTYGSWSYTFTTPGTYHYYSSIIAGEGMSGNIVVTG